MNTLLCWKVSSFRQKASFFFSFFLLFKSDLALACKRHSKEEQNQFATVSRLKPKPHKAVFDKEER